MILRIGYGFGEELICISSSICPGANTWQAKVSIPLAMHLPSAGGNSSPENFLGKLFPDNYPLKCKYIYPYFYMKSSFLRT